MRINAIKYYSPSSQRCDRPTTLLIQTANEYVRFVNLETYSLWKSVEMCDAHAQKNEPRPFTRLSHNCSVDQVLPSSIFPSLIIEQIAGNNLICFRNSELLRTIYIYTIYTHSCVSFLSVSHVSKVRAISQHLINEVEIQSFASQINNRMLTQCMRILWTGFRSSTQQEWFKVYTYPKIYGHFDSPMFDIGNLGISKQDGNCYLLSLAVTDLTQSRDPKWHRA